MMIILQTLKQIPVKHNSMAVSTVYALSRLPAKCTVFKTAQVALTFWILVNKVLTVVPVVHSGLNIAVKCPRL